MSEKLLPCPFCGGVNVVRGGDDKMVAVFCGTCGACGPDEYGSSNEWNRRTPAPEGEAWRHVSQEEMAQAAKFASSNLASPVVPEPEGEVMAWRVKDHAEGWYLFYSEAAAQSSSRARNGALVQPLYASPVVPVGVRERVLDELDKAWLHGQRRTPWRRDESADAILAALRPTDTGREG
jgi:hypothetical protein